MTCTLISLEFISGHSIEPEATEQQNGAEMTSTTHPLLFSRVRTWRFLFYLYWLWRNIKDTHSDNFQRKCLESRTNRGFEFFAPWPNIAGIFFSLSGDILNIFDVGALICSNSVLSVAIISGINNNVDASHSLIIINIF